MKERITKYLEWKATYTKRAAINYRPWLIKFDEVVGKSIEEVTIDDIIRYRKYLDQKYSPYTIQLAMVAMHNFFKFWKLQDVRCISPELVKVPKTVAKSYKALSEEEYCKLLIETPTRGFNGLRNRLILSLLWESGMRVSELCDMDTADIDPEKMMAIIRTKKSDRKRQIFWSESTHKLLLKYIKQRNNKTYSPALLIGCRFKRTTRRLSTRMVQRIVHRAGERAGVEQRISPHSFRHGKAHVILAKGGNVKMIQSILGHSDRNPAASFIYLQLNDKEMEKYARRFL